MKHNIGFLFKKKTIYPYINHIKCILYMEIVESQLIEFDKENNSKLFKCEVCGYIDSNLISLCKHIVQCKVDNK